MLPILRKIKRSDWENPLDLLDRPWRSMFERMDLENGDVANWTAAYPVDIREDEGGIYVDAEMPGFKKEEINVTIEGGMLNISGERKTQESRGEKHLQERRFTRVSRSFTMPVSVDEAKVDAKLEDGVLKLRIPKTEAVKPKKISIK